MSVESVTQVEYSRAREEANRLARLLTSRGLRTGDRLCVYLANCVEMIDLRSNPPPGEAGLRLTAALQQFWRTRGHLSEGRKWSAVALSHPRAQERTNLRAIAPGPAV